MVFTIDSVGAIAARQQLEIHTYAYRHLLKSPQRVIQTTTSPLYNLTGHNATPWWTDGQLVSTAHLPGHPTSNRDTWYPTPDGRDAQIPPATHSQPPACCLNPPSTTTTTPPRRRDAGMDKLVTPPLAPWAWHDDATTTTTTMTMMTMAPPLTPRWHQRHHHRDPGMTMPPLQRCRFRRDTATAFAADDLPICLPLCAPFVHPQSCPHTPPCQKKS
jgi:hypothetical protein